MLDECKGERLEEVLAVFSSAVLKKLVAERALNSGPELRPAISESLSLENWGYSGDRTELNALLLAHKVSLRSLLTKKNAARAKYRDFEELLALKEQGIVRRKEQLKIEAEKSVDKPSEKTKTEINKIIRTNWTGNDQWVDSLLFNDTNPRKGGLLGSSFDDVWAGVQEGRVSDLEDQNTGLLEQLDNRVRLQRARLEKWDDFRKKMFGDLPPHHPEEAKATNKPKGVDLGFTAHQQLSIDRIDTKDQTPLDAPPAQYANIINNMKAELDAIGKPKIPKFSSLVGGPRRGPSTDTVSDVTNPQLTIDPISDISEWEDEPEDKLRPTEKPAQSSIKHHRLAPPKSTFESRRQVPKLSPVEPEPKSDRNKKTYPRLSPELESLEQTLPSQPSISTSSLDKGLGLADLDSIPSALSPHSFAPRDISPSEPSYSGKTIELMPPPPLPVSPTQAMADEILASMSNASPSPMKKHRHTLSLAERTRMSMSRMTSYEKEDDMSRLSPTKPDHAESNADNVSNYSPEKGEEYEDLVARTRRSMVGFEAARQKAQLERRRSQRKSKVVQRKDSYFPKLEEESFVDTSIAEELIEAGQEDYEAVFKSRPRVQTSPLPSPSKAWYEE